MEGELQEFVTLCLKAQQEKRENIFARAESSSTWVPIDDLAKLKKVSRDYLIRRLKKKNHPIKKAPNPRTGRYVTWVYVDEKIKSEIEELNQAPVEVIIDRDAAIHAMRAGVLSIDNLVLLGGMLDKPLPIKTKLPVEIIGKVLNDLVSSIRNNSGWFETDHSRFKADHSRFKADHSRFETDHSRFETDHSRFKADQLEAGSNEPDIKT